MAKAELKTKKTTASVDKYIDSLSDMTRQSECRTVLGMMKKATRGEPKMWGEHIVGFGDYHYKYASGREADWFKMGFSSRKENLTLYFMTGVEPYKAILAKLGKHKMGKGCLYLKSLADVDVDILRKLIETASADLDSSDRGKPQHA